jgi:hypothetical protein
MSDDNGYAVIPRWILKDERFTGNMILTYNALQSFAGPDGSAFPSMAVLAQRARLGTTATRSAIRALEALGIVVSHANFEHGLQSSNRYTVLAHDPNPRDSRATPDVGRGNASRRPGQREALTELAPVTNPRELTPEKNYGAQRETSMSSPGQIEWLCDLHIQGGGTLTPGIKAAFAAMTYDEADSEIQEALALLARGSNFVGDPDDPNLSHKGRERAIARLIPSKGTG